MTIWGANLYVPANSASVYLHARVFQAAQEMGLSHLLIWQQNFNEGGGYVTEDQLEAAVTLMKSYNLKPLIGLRYDVSAATSLVRRLGSDCDMYEVCKEPHVSGTSCAADAATYVIRWNHIVDACRAINPNAMYGGPAVGSFPNTSRRSSTWMRAFLSGAHNPDFVSVHSFNYSSGQTKDQVVARACTDPQEDIVNLREMLAAYGRSSLPIVYSEVQWTSSASSPRWDTDTTLMNNGKNFMDNYTSTLMQTLKDQNVYAMFFWVLIGFSNVFCIITPPPNYTRKLQFTSIKACAL